ARDADGMNGYAWALATSPDPAIRNGAEAVRWGTQAVAARPGPQVRDTLAAAYAEAGDWTRALAEQRRAVSEMPPSTPAAERTSLEEHLASIERHEAIRETRGEP